MKGGFTWAQSGQQTRGGQLISVEMAAASDGLDFRRTVLLTGYYLRENAVP